jgi:hypothetical protein
MDTPIKVLQSRIPSFTDMVDATESFLNTHLGNAVTFLDEHPGISMLLNPTSITRRVAYKHVDRMINRER